MGRFNEISLTAKQPEKNTEAHDHSCLAHGCPRIPTITHEGRKICRYHYGRAAKDWGYISMTLNNHKCEIDWYEKMLYASIVDFIVRKLDTYPESLKPRVGEDFFDYRRRLWADLSEILYPKEPAPIIDRKRIASGEIA